MISLLKDSTVYCSAITVVEVFAGIRKHEREKTTEIIDSLNIVDVTRELAEKAGMYKRDGKRQSLELDDCLIATTAFITKSVLATGNVKHYPMADIQKIIVKM